MHALVTGGAGFIGSHLCERLLHAGHRVTCLDNFSTGSYDNLDGCYTTDASFNMIEADITDHPELPIADHIFALSSMASPDEFTENPLEIALANTEGLRYLLEHARDTGARMLYTSTSEVYGDPEVHPQPETYTGNVNIRGPRSCYDESKRFGETLAHIYREQFGVDVRTARIFNTYGPRMAADDGRVIPTFVSQALDGEPLTVYGDGEQTRSFCYVRDTVDALLGLMVPDAPRYEVYNVGSSAEMTILTLAEMIQHLTGSEAEIAHEPLPDDDPQRRRPLTARIEHELDWEPTVSMQHGLQATIDYFAQA